MASMPEPFRLHAADGSELIMDLWVSKTYATR
jgi:hypothetical protein